MRSSDFFMATQFNWGSQALGSTTAYVSNVECEYFDSSTTTIALLYKVVNSASAGSATITCSFRRSL